MPLAILPSAPLAPLTTFGLGGPARFFAEVTEPAHVAEALAWAKEQDLPVFILGGGSNLVVADEGFPGLVLHMRTRGQTWTKVGTKAGSAWRG